MIYEREDGTFDGVPEGCTVRRSTRKEPMYGPYHGGDPREFFPDPECSTDEEREAHRLACERWDAGEQERKPREEGHCHFAPNMILCTSGAFGLGTSEVELDVLEIVHPDGSVTVAY